MVLCVPHSEVAAESLQQRAGAVCAQDRSRSAATSHPRPASSSHLLSDNHSAAEARNTPDEAKQNVK